MNKNITVTVTVTVKELINTLKSMNQDAVVCSFETDGVKDYYSTIEICKQVNNVVYIDDNGDDVIGDVVTIF